MCLIWFLAESFNRVASDRGHRKFGLHLGGKKAPGWMLEGGAWK